MLSDLRAPQVLCLALLVLCAPFAGACGRQEQEQRKAFIEFLETNVIAAEGLDRFRMSDVTRKQVGNYGRHFDVIAAYAKELGDINARLTGEKMRLAAQGPVPMDKLGSERTRIERLVAAFSRSAQQIDAVMVRADAAKAALKQPEDVRAAFEKAFEKEVSGYAAVLQDVFAVQKDFYAEAARMGMFFEKHREKMHFKNATLTIDDQALVTEYNALQQSLQEKARKMQDALASGRSLVR
jgi:chaperonin cofactor prefoldin